MANRRSNLYEINENGCWIALRAIAGSGYPQMSVNNKSTKMSRYFYEEYIGKIPNGLVLDHLCRNKLCVNPQHLEAVTQAENVMRGNRVKLNKTEVRLIRLIYKYTNLTQKEIAKRFGVGQDNISRIVRNLYWKGI